MFLARCGCGRDRGVHRVQVGGVELGRPEGVELEGVELEGEGLEGVELEGEGLEGVELEGEGLEGVELEPVELEPVELEPVELEPVELEPVELEGEGLEVRAAQPGWVGAGVVAVAPGGVSRRGPRGAVGGVGVGLSWAFGGPLVGRWGAWPVPVGVAGPGGVSGASLGLHGAPAASGWPVRLVGWRPAPGAPASVVGSNASAVGVQVIAEALAVRELVARVRLRLVVVEAVRSLRCPRCRVEVEGVRACSAEHGAEVLLRVLELVGVRDAR